MATNAGTAPPSGPTAMLERVVSFAQGRAAERVRVLRARHPKEDRRALADRLVTSFSRRAGMGGAATGALALVSLGVGLPAGVALTLALEAELLLSLMDLYGLEGSGERGRLRLYALWAGGALADAAKSVGLRAGADALGKVLGGSLPARIIARLNPILVRTILKRLGMGWLPRALKLWPVLGAPLGYLLDSTAVRALGKATVATLESLPVPAPAQAPEEEAPPPPPKARKARRRPAPREDA